MKELGKLLNKKSDLFKCIFITLLFQLLITYSTIQIDNKYDITKNFNNILFLIIIFIFMVFILYILPNIKSMIGKQLLFGLFSIIVGLLMSISLKNIDKNVIINAFKSTLINFVVIFIFGIILGYYGIDLSWLGLFLFISLIILITISIINLLNYNRNETFNKNISIIIIVIFSLYILYDTNNILLRYDNNSNNCVNGALDYYLDIWNLFTSYLNLSR